MVRFSFFFCRLYNIIFPKAFKYVCVKDRINIRDAHLQVSFICAGCGVFFSVRMVGVRVSIII